MEGWKLIGIIAVSVSTFNISVQVMISLYRLYKGLYDNNNKAMICYLIVLGGPLISLTLLSDFLLVGISSMLVQNQDDFLSEEFPCPKLGGMCYTVLGFSFISLLLKVLVIAKYR